MKNNAVNKLRHKDIGIGGKGCPCCAASPKHRKKAARTNRRRLKMLDILRLT